MVMGEGVELRSHRKLCICLQICSVILHKYRIPLRNFAFTHLMLFPSQKFYMRLQSFSRYTKDL